MADTIVKGFPISVGAKIMSSVDHVGPASYTVVTPGATPTGGDSITATALGMKSIEAILEVSGDNTGTYSVVGIRTGTDALGSPTWILQWLTTVGNVQVVGTTDLSAKHVRVSVIGI
jgi:hypothetical protein